MTGLLNSIDGFRNLPIPEVEEKRQDHFVEPDGQPDELADKLLGGLLVGLLVDFLLPNVRVPQTADSPSP